MESTSLVLSVVSIANMGILGILIEVNKHSRGVFF